MLSGANCTSRYFSRNTDCQEIHGKKMSNLISLSRNANKAERGTKDEAHCRGCA